MMEILSPSGRDGLVARPPMPAAAIERGAPAITGYTYRANDATGVKIVVWGATPYRIHPKQRPDFEFSLLLEGSVILTDGQGGDIKVEAGDAFVLPAGFTYQWGQHEPVLKYALSYTPATPAGPGSVFTPMRAAALRGHGPLAAPLTLFAEPSGRFRAVLADCGPGRAPLVIPAGETLLTAVSGSPTVAEVGGDTLALAPGQSALVAASGPVTVNASGAARVLFCTVAS